VMGLVTLVYTWMGGLKAVIWADVVQLIVYVAGGVVALWLAWQIGGGADQALGAAAEAGKLRIIDATRNFTDTYTLLGGLIGGAMLSAASHGTDQLIVQRLLATRSLRDAVPAGGLGDLGCRTGPGRHAAGHHLPTIHRRAHAGGTARTRHRGDTRGGDEHDQLVDQCPRFLRHL